MGLSQDDAVEGRGRLLRAHRPLTGLQAVVLLTNGWQRGEAEAKGRGEWEKGREGEGEEVLGGTGGRRSGEVPAPKGGSRPRPVNRGGGDGGSWPRGQPAWSEAMSPGRRATAVAAAGP